MIDYNSHGQEGSFTGAAISIGFAIVSIIPSVFEWTKRFDVVFVPFLHLIQGLAACIAIVVGVLTIIDWCGKQIKKRNGRPL